MSEALNEEVIESTEEQGNVLRLQDFVADYGPDLMRAVQEQNPPLYDGDPDPLRAAVLEGLARQPFPEQADAVQAMLKLLVDEGMPAGVINGEMGTGKTMMGIALATATHREGYRRCLVLAPPHLVYKWRREILETVPKARVWVLNGPDTLAKLLKLRAALGAEPRDDVPEFFVLGRVRMRMGFHWRPAVAVRREYVRQRLGGDLNDTRGKSFVTTQEYAACPSCGTVVCNSEGEALTVAEVEASPTRRKCSRCAEALWTLRWPKRQQSQSEQVMRALLDIPTIGHKTAERLVGQFGSEFFASMLSDNIHQFVNLMDEDGELVFSDRQAKRMERALAKMEFGWGQGGYQPSEFIKRQLPTGYFGLMLADEGHEYKNYTSAQGQAMGVLANKVRKVVLLTGTLMGGYAEDLFYLLWRMMPGLMRQDGFNPAENGSMTPAGLTWMQLYGILEEVFTEYHDGEHKTAKGTKTTVRTKKRPGFSPQGIVRYVLPFTGFLRLKDIKGNVLPSFDEETRELPMSEAMRDRYDDMSLTLTAEMRQALARGDNTLLGVVMATLLRWPDTPFKEEVVKHPRTRALLAFVPTLFGEEERTPKEQELLNIVREEKAAGRRVLVYSTYTGKHDTCSRLKSILQEEGYKVAVLRSSVSTAKREDWLIDQVDRGVDVVITNPELVKTGLDLLDFPTIVFMQTGYNVYTLWQASRRSWRIGQRADVRVIYLGYEKSGQAACLKLMAQKVAVAQSTSGEIPDNGLQAVNSESEGSIEVELAKQLLRAA